MKAYHIRKTVSDATVDSIYIPEYEIFKSYIHEPKCMIIVDYSLKDYLKRAQAVVEGKEDNALGEIFNEIDIDKKTAKKIKKAKSGFNEYLDTAGTTENLIRIFSERAPKTLAELVKSLIS